MTDTAALVFLSSPRFPALAVSGAADGILAAARITNVDTAELIDLQRLPALPGARVIAASESPRDDDCTPRGDSDPAPGPDIEARAIHELHPSGMDD